MAVLPAGRLPDLVLGVVTKDSGRTLEQVPEIGGTWGAILGRSAPSCLLGTVSLLLPCACLGRIPLERTGTVLPAAARHC